MNQQRNGGPGEAIVEFQHRQEALGTVDVASARQIAEVQAAMIVAKRFPRNHADAYARIMTACKRKSLAEDAIYSFPRGGSKIEGPTIRLAEALAQNWGNIDFGIIELEQRDGESSMMSYAVDLETNTRQTKVFTVPHVRKSHGQLDKLTDPRDIYEMTANIGARRLRKCILGIIPGDVVDAAVEQCNKTMLEGSDEPLQDRVRKMVAYFNEMGVTRVQIEQRLGHKIDSMSEAEYVGLRKIIVSLKNEASAPSQWFRPMPPDGSGPELTPDDLKPAQPRPAERPKAPHEWTRDDLKAEAMRLGLVDQSCSWGAQRLADAVVTEHKRLEAQRAMSVHADEPPDDLPLREPGDDGEDLDVE